MDHNPVTVDVKRDWLKLSSVTCDHVHSVIFEQLRSHSAQYLLNELVCNRYIEFTIKKKSYTKEHTQVRLLCQISLEMSLFCRLWASRRLFDTLKKSRPHGSLRLSKTRSNHRETSTK
jgi:hypothetical protein